MYRMLYSISPGEWLAGLLILITAWGFARRRFGKTAGWRACHALALLIWLLLTLYTTLIERESGNGALCMEPFWSYREALEGSLDYFQEIYLNVTAFAVFGFAASELFPNGTGLILLAGMALSAGVEYLQFRLDVGFAELDDVFSNALGTLLGTVIHQNTDRYIAAVKRLGAAWRKSLSRFLHRHTTE